MAMDLPHEMPLEMPMAVSMTMPHEMHMGQILQDGENACFMSFFF